MTDNEREQLLLRWTSPPSESEDERAENACRIMRDAVKSSQQLAKWDIDIFIQGSYKNSTNVRLASDVDVCVCLKDTITTDYHFAPDLSDEKLGFQPPAYTYGQFKDDLGTALRAAFGKENVTRGNKAYNVKANSYRVTADVVACLEHRRYESSGAITYGTTLLPDNGGKINNFPAQHYSNGVAKNKRTNSYFKQAVRIMKNLRNRMTDEGSSAAKPIASYLNECLVWNTTDSILLIPSWSATIRATLVYLWDHLQTDEMCGEWGQVSELLYLFKGLHGYSREQARDWVYAAWNWLEYK